MHRLGVAAVLVDDQRLVERLGQPVGLLGVVVDQFDVHLVLQLGGDASSNFAITSSGSFFAVNPTN